MLFNGIVSTSLNRTRQPFFRDKRMMLEEVRSGQIVLAFPITWYFNETDALESRSGTQPLGRFASTERFRRGVRWERIAAIGLVTAAGAFAGAVTGATLGPVGAVAGATAGGAGGYIMGNEVADGQGWRRRRDTLSAHRGLECQLLCQAFVASDLDQDGRLSAKEIRLTTDESTRIFQILDRNNNTFLDPSEFSSCLFSRRLRRGYDCGYDARGINASNDATFYKQTGHYVPAIGTIYV